MNTRRWRRIQMQSTRRKLIYSSISWCNTIYEPTKLYYLSKNLLRSIICYLYFIVYCNTIETILGRSDNAIRSSPRIITTVSHPSNGKFKFCILTLSFVIIMNTTNWSTGARHAIKTIQGFDTPVHMSDSAPNFSPIGSPTHHPSEHKWLAGSG